jgi:hypothetical protein
MISRYREDGVGVCLCFLAVYRFVLHVVDSREPRGIWANEVFFDYGTLCKCVLENLIFVHDALGVFLPWSLGNRHTRLLMLLANSNSDSP